MLNRFQAAAAKSYALGDYAYLIDPDHTVDLAVAIAANQFGDTLFNFLMIELSADEDCEDLDTAKRRVDSAIADLQAVRAALDDLEG